MDNLSKNWFSEDNLDFEFKKYILLAYLQKVEKRFNQTRLYPHLSDLVYHYQNLLNIKEKQEVFKNAFPKDIKGINTEKLEIEYESIEKEKESIKELMDIVNYSIPQFQSKLDRGKEMFEFIKDSIKIEPVGVESIYKEEGFFMLSGSTKEIDVYRFKVSFFSNSIDKFRTIHSKFIGRYAKSFYENIHSIKLKLMKKEKEFSNPATYLFQSKFQFPLEDSFLPVSQRLFLSKIYNEGK